MRATPLLYRTAFVALMLFHAALPATADDKPNPVELSEAAARGTCAVLASKSEIMPGPCTVLEFGSVGRVAGNDLLYGRYAFHVPNSDDVMAISAVIYERRPGGMLHVLFVPGDAGGFYDKPEILRTADRILLHLPGHDSGAGNFNLERMFVWHGAWGQADVGSWTGDLAKRLPKGYAVWKGVYPNYRKMTAATPLWRDGTDGNCCPTGGGAEISFAWQGDRLMVKAVQVKLGAKYAGQ